MPVAFLGTGLLGAGFVEAAAGRGEKLVVWNRTIEKAKALERFGVRVATSPADAVRGCERVHLVLKDDAAVEEVIAAFRSAMTPGAIIVDHSTTLPKLTADRSARLAAQGVQYLHCPVFIGPAAARKAKGSILVSGPRALFDQVRPGLEAMAERVEYFGDRPDFAAVLKLCGNAFIIGITSLVADMFAVARATDVSPHDALRVFEFFDPTSTVTGRGRNMADGKFTPSFELAMARKDVRLMIETAGPDAVGALAGIAARMDALIAAGYGADDLAAMGRTL
jgi:3-hydroxyisobutyrate dehydrogenase